MLSPRLAVNQHSFAEVRPPFTARLARVRVWGRFAVPGGALFVLRATRHEDHTPSPVGQRTCRSAPLPDFLNAWSFKHRASGRKSDREPANRRGVGRTVDSSEGTGTCQSVTSFSRLARQPGLPHVATTSVNKPLAAQPSAQAPQRSQAARFCKVQPSAPQPTSAIASSTPANVTNQFAALPTLRAGRAALPTIFTSIGNAQPPLTRLFALPVTVKGTADV